MEPNGIAEIQLQVFLFSNQSRLSTHCIKRSNCDFEFMLDDDVRHQGHTCTRLLHKW